MSQAESGDLEDPSPESLSENLPEDSPEEIPLYLY